MFKRLKPGKISIVVFLTALIWVWADLSQDDQLTLYDVRIEVAKSTDPYLWINFAVEGADPNLQTSVALDTVGLKGPASRITEVSRRKNRGVLDLNLFLVPEQEGLTENGSHMLNVLDFLRKSDEFRNLGLSVENCEPPRLTVVTRKLVEQFIPVECVGLDPGLEASLDPSSVAAYVPVGRTLKARIPRLSVEEQNQAKIAPIEKTPYIELIPGQRRDIATKVKVSLAPAQNVLTETQFRPTIGFCFSTNTQGKYKVVLENGPTELNRISIRATAAARLAYVDNSDYHLELYIRDQDAQVPEDQWPISRELVFKFPDEYVRKGEIEASGDPPIAKFHLVPVAAEPSPQSVVE